MKPDTCDISDFFLVSKQSILWNRSSAGARSESQISESQFDLDATCLCSEIHGRRPNYYQFTCPWRKFTIFLIWELICEQISFKENFSWNRNFGCNLISNRDDHLAPTLNRSKVILLSEDIESSLTSYVCYSTDNGNGAHSKHILQTD